MPGKNIVRVSEFEKLLFDESDDTSKPFKKKHWEALGKYQENQHRNKKQKNIEYYRVLTKGIQFTNYVGVIQAGNLTIEILPKTDRDKTTVENLKIDDSELKDSKDFTEKQKWHSVLLQMLKECKKIKVSSVNFANLNLKNNSLLETYLEIFLDEVDKLLRTGLVKKYRSNEGNKFALKGQLLFSKNIAKNLVHNERFYVKYADYNSNNIYNQILYKTIRLIPKLCNSYYLNDKVGRILLNFPEMQDCNVTESTFERLTYNRKTEGYQEAVLISKMLLLNYRPDISGGSENVIAILFDMNKLWEEFVYLRLLKNKGNDIEVFAQKQNKFWKNITTDTYKIVKPDIVIIDKRSKDMPKTYVVDTKWKIIKNAKPDDDDLKQMFVYNLFWGAEKSFLLYPDPLSSKENTPITEGSYLSFPLLPTKEPFSNHCSLNFLKVELDDNKKINNCSFNSFLENVINGKALQTQQ